MKAQLNMAVIGAGYWGKKIIYEYLNIVRKRPNVNVAMVCDLDDKNLDYCRDAYNIFEEKLTRSYQDVINSSNVNAVHICTPNETHYKICKEALQSGKHVLLEKPMTLASKQAFELVNIATSKNLILQAGHIFRFNNALKKIRKLIQQNYFGDIYYLKLQWTNLISPPPNRDIIFDLAPHPIDIVHLLFSQWPTKVTCKAGAYRRKEPEEVAYILTELNRNTMIHIELSWLQPGRTRELTVVGSKRCATVDCLNQTIQIHENNSNKTYDLEVQRNNTIETEITHFVNCVSHQQQRSMNSGLIGAKNVEVLEHIRKSLEEKVK